MAGVMVVNLKYGETKLSEDINRKYTEYTGVIVYGGQGDNKICVVTLPYNDSIDGGMGCSQESIDQHGKTREDTSSFAINNGRWIFSDLSGKEATYLVTEIYKKSPKHAIDILKNQRKEKKIVILSEMEASNAADILSEMEASNAADILSEMEASNAADILSEMEASNAAAILSEMLFRAKLGVFLYLSTLHEKEDAFNDIGHLRTVGNLIGVKPLHFKGQIILQGPPGTGKSYTAKNISRALTGDKDPGEKWKVVQFHPSYNYEDFVRGIQISTEPCVENENKEETEQSGQVQYHTVNRIFAEMCESAKENPTEPYVLIIDEMNRANLPAVLGELIYGLEYRGEEVNTPYEVNGSKGLVIPENLFVIGTMNTADRSIGHIDYAIRRRFAFIDVLPDSAVIKDQKAENYFKVVENVFEDHLNSNDYRQNHVQIGHSYFLPNKGNEFAEGELELKMKYEVLPILREYVIDGILTDSNDKLLERLQSMDFFESAQDV